MNKLKRRIGTIMVGVPLVIFCYLFVAYYNEFIPKVPNMFVVNAMFLFGAWLMTEFD
jgi:hypothetical protein